MLSQFSLTKGKLKHEPVDITRNLSEHKPVNTNNTRHFFKHERVNSSESLPEHKDVNTADNLSDFKIQNTTKHFPNEVEIPANSNAYLNKSEQLSNPQVKYRCCIPNCPNKFRHRSFGPKYEGNKMFHRIPRDPHTRKSWIETIYRNTGRKIPWKSYQTVCEDHFLSKTLLHNKRLMYASVPTLFPLELEAENEGVKPAHKDTEEEEATKFLEEIHFDYLEHLGKYDAQYKANFLEIQQSNYSSNYLFEHNYCLRLPTQFQRPIQPITQVQCVKPPQRPLIIGPYNDKFQKYRSIKNNCILKKRQLFKDRLLKFNTKLYRKLFINPPTTQTRVSTMRYSGIISKKQVFTLAKKGKKKHVSIQDINSSVVVPTGCNLKALLHNSPFKSGLNSVVLDRLSQKVEEMPRSDTFCALLFGTVPLTSSLKYCTLNDQFIGFSDSDNNHYLATHALVFMVQGITSCWKQPIAYSFINESNRIEYSKDLLVSTIQSLQKIGLKIVAIVCKQTLTNKTILSDLSKETNSQGEQEPYFIVNKQKIFTVYDPSSLLVATRNVFEQYQVEFVPHKLAEFQQIQLSLNIDKQRLFRKLPKFRQKYLKLGKRNYLRLNVDIAAQTLSYSMASCIEAYLGEEGLNTAKFIYDMNMLFASLSDHKRARKILLWKQMLAQIKRWTFYTRTDGVLKTNLPIKQGLMTTLKAVLALTQKLKDKKLQSFKTKCLNLDSLQNFFAGIQYLGAKNRRPTSYEFEAAFKLSILNNMVLPYNAKSNCKQDEGFLLDNYRDTFKKSTTKFKRSIRINSEITNITESTFKMQQSDITAANKIATKACKIILKKKFTCNTCRNSLIINSAQLLNPTIFNATSIYFFNVYILTKYILESFTYVSNIRKQILLYLKKRVYFDWFQCDNVKHRKVMQFRLLNLGILLVIKQLDIHLLSNQYKAKTS